jgi:hypothetical protein
MALIDVPSPVCIDCDVFTVEPGYCGAKSGKPAIGVSFAVAPSGAVAVVMVAGVAGVVAFPATGAADGVVALAIAEAPALPAVPTLFSSFAALHPPSIGRTAHTKNIIFFIDTGPFLRNMPDLS